ncbi:LOW QUALITY PROTEIN: hypothetical protein U9M48_002718 [Paspalum notatum var. saurae]
MDFATGAFGALLPKLAVLLKEEYNLHKSVKGGVRFLMAELESMHAALEKVSSVPTDQLDKNVRLWARDVREMSYSIEDSIDTFLVRVEGKKTAKPHSIKGFIDRSLNSLSNFATISPLRLRILGNFVTEAKERRDRYSVDNVVLKPTTAFVDPRLAAMFIKATELVAIEGARDELIKKLSEGDDISNNKLRIVSVFGLGGLGKTTLTKIVYDKLRLEFKCSAFVSVGQGPDVKKVLKDILLELDRKKFENVHNTTRDEIQLINQLHKFLKKKRYFIVIDDIWDIQSWETIKLALNENNCGSRIVITTRKFDVAKEAGDIYNLQPLSYGNSKRLFHTRIFGGEAECPSIQKDEVLDKILKKCGGIPLAIITMASLLAGKPSEEWFEVYSSIGFSHRDNRHAENTMRILSFSYYDMPSHLRTCLLYLCIFPEDYIIHKDQLIWKWIAEGFINEEQGAGLFDLGEKYFNELINRCMIQPVKNRLSGIIGCRIHDMVYGLIRSLSCAENFVTVLDQGNDTLASINVHRLSVQKKMIEHDPQDDMAITHARSFIACLCYIGKIVPLSTFHVLRVLALEECLFMEDHHLTHLGYLVHLRYLGLNGTPILGLPKEISALKFLQTLALDRTGIEELPLSMGTLTQLLCLHGDTMMKTRTNGILRKLTSLEELRMCPGNASDDKISTRQFMIELRNLKKLRVLHIYIDNMEMDEDIEQALLESLCSLPNISRLEMTCEYSLEQVLRWETPKSFHSLNLRHLLLDNFLLSSLPTWINYSLLPNLSSLYLDVESMDFRDMRILGRLPQLCCLHLWTRSTFVVTGGDGNFRKLKTCLLYTSVNAMFRTDRSGGTIMPKVEELRFYVNVRCTMDVCNHHGQEISFLPVVIGLHNLPSLNKIDILVNCENATPSEVDDLEAALMNAAYMHPNHPVLQMGRQHEAKMITSDEGLQLPSVNCRDVIDYNVHVRELNDTGYAVDFTHLANLPLLEKIIACINCEDATAVEVEEAVAAMRHAAGTHPNRPTLQVEWRAKDKMQISSDQNDQLLYDDVATEVDEDDELDASTPRGE